MIWNKENAVNVTEKLKDYAEIHVRYDQSVHVRECQNVSVEIIKKRDFGLGDFFDLCSENIVLTRFVDKLMEQLALNSSVFLKLLENASFIG